MLDMHGTAFQSLLNHKLRITNHSSSYAASSQVSTLMDSCLSSLL